VSALAHDSSAAGIDERTLAILEHRRAARPFRSRGALIRRLLLVADVVGLTAAFALTELIAGGELHRGVSTRAEFAVFFLSLPLWVALAGLYRLYDRDEERTEHSTADDLVGVLHLVIITTWAFWMVGAATHLVNADAEKSLLFSALALAFVTSGRAAARSAARHSLSYIQNCVIVGAGDVGQLLARKLRLHPEYGVNLVGFVDANPKERRDVTADIPVLGTLTDLPDLVARYEIDRVIVAFSAEPPPELVRVLRTLRQFDVQVDIVPRLFDVVGPHAQVSSIEGIQLIGISPPRLSRPARIAKRCIDVVVAAATLAVSSPLFAYAAWRIRRESPGPVFFRQTRLGMHQRPFTALKFRTMKDGTPSDAHRDYIMAALDPNASPQGNGLYKLDRSDVVTPFGSWLRRTGLDELPQLINVLKGDMSLVGPRPCIPYETERYEPHHFERFLVPAGITGLWQVRARARSTFGEALDMDVAYARSWSFGLDLRLILQTPVELLRRQATR
jgi:exopolysaccharide biosynthesis polyprenyl glycosylphosphotransferase